MFTKLTSIAQKICLLYRICRSCSQGKCEQICRLFLFT